MNILIAYATNSGSTYLVSQMIEEQLEGHTVQLHDISTMHPDDFLAYDLIIFGSPSWDFEHKEGQPHYKFFQFFREFSDFRTLMGKKCAVFALGDKSYTYFCGAADELTKFVTEKQGELIVEPLKINRFYFSDTEQVKGAIQEWVKSLLQSAEK